MIYTITLHGKVAIPVIGQEGRQGKKRECHCEIEAASGFEGNQEWGCPFQFLTFGYTSMSGTKGVQSRKI